MKSFRSWNPGRSWWRDPVSVSAESEISGTDSRIGIVVDAGPSLGYGHAVRCLRLANALTKDAAVMVYPLSESCRDFFLNASPAAKFEICEPDWETKRSEERRVGKECRSRWSP